MIIFAIYPPDQIGLQTAPDSSLSIQMYSTLKIIINLSGEARPRRPFSNAIKTSLVINKQQQSSHTKNTITMNDAQEINANFMLQYGFMRSHGENVANFRQAFGASPDSAANIWMDLRQSTDENIRLDSTGASIAHLFWTFYFLKTYPKQRNLTAAFRSRCSKTLMRWIKHYIYKLSMLKEYKVSRRHIVSFFAADIS